SSYWQTVKITFSDGATAEVTLDELTAARGEGGAVLGRNFFADMATSTNAYVVVHGGRLWADTTEDEMRFFFGILILMGVN
ncbi:hypothetical protein NP493_2748g00008, partial [Ridgeia piscesae]